MKNITLYIICFLVGCLYSSNLQASNHDGIISNLKFKHISTSNGLPSNEVQKVFQDREGFIWFATRYVFCKYDGYEITTFKSDLHSPSILTNNNIICLTSDADRNIWLGTLEGLNVYNKETGEIRKCRYPGIDNHQVLCLLVTKDNTLWIGNTNGLFRYDREADRMVLFSDFTKDHSLSQSAISYLYEDSDGDLWIGTRSDGFFRYDIKADKLHSYPETNPRNAHIIFEDSHKQIWIIGWDEGLFLLKNPKDSNRISSANYRHQPDNEHSLQDNMAYDICEDIHTRTLWIGTRSGLSIMKLDTPGEFTNYRTIEYPYYIPFDEANAIIRDHSGKMWIGTIGNGVYIADTKEPEFNLYQFKQQDKSITTTSIRSLFVDDDNCVWFGIGTYGIARYDRNTQKYAYYANIPEFSEVKVIPTVYSIIRRKQSAELWFGTYDGGLFVYRKGEKVRHYTSENTDFIIHSCITALYEDSKGNCWIGTRQGLSVKRADGTGYLFREIKIEGGILSSFYIRKITEDKDHNIWIATNNNGIIRISGDVSKPENLTYKRYHYDNGKIGANSIQTLFPDSKGRLWAGTEGYGLFLYNEEKDVFDSKNTIYNLPCDMIGSIEEDGDGGLWLGTNIGLMRLGVSADTNEASLHIYTSADGLQDNFFIPRSSYVKNGEMFFGGHNGFNSFFPDKMTKDSCAETPLFITDIKIFNNSLSTLDKETRSRISIKEAPYTDKITLSYQQNNFSIEFASLTYKNPELNKYAYKLDGFDPDWLHTDANRHFAYYNNLKTGKYTFKLRGTNENGIWNKQVRELQIVILPPPWATWQAYLCYILLTAIILFLIYRNLQNRVRLKNRLQLQKMEQSKSEEINHAKLQFFTNITHELLTPLTIISATVDELKMQAPQYSNLYPVITTNIKRLIRLLQQILEFRKAETGNLKLRVSKGDIAIFVKNEAEAFLPLIKKQKLHFSVLCDPESITGYFDVDKLDKILYNLFSNAAKYSKEGGFIQVNLSYAENKDFILITVKDNGEGISPENQKTLFKRFYEGDYRKFNTIGTGIGLSLVKDLVNLHSGHISVESEPGKGSVFSIRLPIERSYFKEEEIDDEFVYQNKAGIFPEPVMPEVSQENKVKKHSILVLEDNEELLSLMVTLLGREYTIFTGENGKEGLVIIENEEIDLIVSDIMMPEMDGIEFCKLIKNKVEFSHIPILLLTAKNKEEDRAEAYESGADGFISKPFNLAVLHARIKNLIKSKERVARDFKKQLVFEAKDLNYTSLDEEFMQKAIDCVNRHIEDPDFDQIQFIEEMATSKSTLYRKLKSLTGLNTSAFIRNIRLKAAVDIMSKKQHVRISELAYAVGFNDPKYFSSCFKKEFGMLPSEYIERYLPEKRE